MAHIQGVSARQTVVATKEAAPSKPRALVVSSIYTEAEMANQVGREAYSYRFVYQQFAHMLERWGRTSEVNRPESCLEYALWRAKQQGLEPFHLSFLPLHLTYLAQGAPNIAVPAWEFPDIPNINFHNNPRNNWVRIANQLDLIIVHCNITRNAFLRAGVKTPIHLVPPPIADEYFSVPPWQPHQRVVINCPSYVFPQPDPLPPPAHNPWIPVPLPPAPTWKSRAKDRYKRWIKPYIPGIVDRYLTLAVRSVRHAHQQVVIAAAPPPAFATSPTLELTGIVYTTMFNPYDPRKNWQDMFSAYLTALADKDDATLVVKLVICPELAPHALHALVDHYRRLGLKHRCRLVFVTAYLTKKQMYELCQGTTYYLNTSKAEGSCLPLQDYMAAHRPGIAPVHTGIADYMDDQVGFPIASHIEPAAWPHDPEQKLTTTWHRMVWKSLHDQLRASYDLAKQNVSKYRALGAAASERLAKFAGAEAVWPALVTALNSVTDQNREKKSKRMAG